MQITFTSSIFAHLHGVYLFKQFPVAMRERPPKKALNIKSLAKEVSDVESLAKQVAGLESLAKDLPGIDKSPPPPSTRKISKPAREPKPSYGIPPGFRKGTYAMEKDGVECLILPNGVDPKTGHGMFDRGALEAGCIGLTYPERLFVWGVSNQNQDLPHDRTMTRLKDLDSFKMARGFWWDKLLHHGYKGGTPLFHNALMAHTDIGMCWHDLYKLLAKENLPYTWQEVETRQGGGGGTFWSTATYWIDERA